MPNSTQEKISLNKTHPDCRDNYQGYGQSLSLFVSTRPKTNPKETLIKIKERIIELRKERKDIKNN